MAQLFEAKAHSSTSHTARSPSRHTAHPLRRRGTRAHACRCMRASSPSCSPSPARLMLALFTHPLPIPLLPQPHTQLGIDYSKLRDHLAAGQWREAEDEHRAVLMKMAGADAVKRGWVYFSEVKSIPDVDMQTLDRLWAAASAGKFGFAVQKEIWLQVGGGV